MERPGDGSTTHQDNDGHNSTVNSRDSSSNMDNLPTNTNPTTEGNIFR